MKTIREFMAVMAVLLTCGCASVEKNSYITIGTTSVAVEAARAAFIDYANASRAVKQSTYDEVQKLYERYQQSMLAAQAMVAAYKANPEPGADNLTAALVPASQAASALIVLIQQQLPPDRQKTLKAKLGEH